MLSANSTTVCNKLQDAPMIAMNKAASQCSVIHLGLLSDLWRTSVQRPKRWMTAALARVGCRTQFSSPGCRELCLSRSFSWLGQKFCLPCPQHNSSTHLSNATHGEENAMRPRRLFTIGMPHHHDVAVPQNPRFLSTHLTPIISPSFTRSFPALPAAWLLDHPAYAAHSNKKKTSEHE